MGSEAEKKYAEFEEKVKNYVYLDNLSPQVNKTDIETAFTQFVNVKSVHFIPNYTLPNYNSKCALVELENKKQAGIIIDELSRLPFMMMGMPRPVRALPAVPEMFSDRPAKPGREIPLKWLGPSDPGFELAQKHKALVRKHGGQRDFLLQKQVEMEEKLHNDQAHNLKEEYEKLKLIEDCEQAEKTLALRFGKKITEDGGS